MVKLKCHLLICITFVYLTKQSEFGKVEVTLTPAENSFFKALVLLKF